ncbi:FAD-dependent oxidoreductase [Geomonas limicola]|uniref:FAD-dependent oxidoreductase n=1 Tax=Geomonas limicola TaxID=2740186 RepID=A0A6V8N7A5_9BACT|nr:FAD-dependent oxidoreductase [Geomonas limicola]GFO67717.1 FAD-dependent oxidoreductase [Geomonas limicola]
MEQFEVIVIGAGISGLSFASYAVQAGLKTLVIEKSERVGGCFHSHQFTGTAEGFWLELGAHTCYNSYGGLIGLLERHGMLDSLQPREKVGFKMLVGDEIKSIPSQLSFFELALSGWHLFTAKKEGESVESYYGGIVGRGNYRKVFAPAFNAVLSQRANDFPADMLFNKRPRRKDIIKSYTFKSGLSSVTDRLGKMSGLTLATGAQVRRIAQDDAGYTLELADGRCFTCDKLVLALPPSEGARLCGGFAPELTDLLAQIKSETIESVGVAVEKSKLSVPLLAGIIPIEDDFYSAVSRDTVAHPTLRGFSFHFKVGRLSLEAKLKRIAKVLKVRVEDLEQPFERVSNLPSPVLGHHQLTADLDRSIAGQKLFVTGNYFAGMAIEDCIVRSQREFARLTAGR